MISDVDESLRALILDSLTVSRQNVDIKFDLPTRDWASRLNRPTIDIFLFDIRCAGFYGRPGRIIRYETIKRAADML